MTREEAVIILDGFKNNPLFSDTHVQALDMAISALSEKDKIFYYDHGYAQAKRDLAENKGDLINRQAVLDELEKWDWQDLYLPIHFKQILDDIPSADVRPNIHGHWKVGFGNTWCSCSECSGNGSTNWSYCPWCGADMREPKGEKGTK